MCENPSGFFRLSPGSSGYLEVLAICCNRGLNEDANTIKRKEPCCSNAQITNVVTITPRNHTYSWMIITIATAATRSSKQGKEKSVDYYLFNEMALEWIWFIWWKQINKNYVNQCSKCWIWWLQHNFAVIE